MAEYNRINGLLEKEIETEMDFQRVRELKGSYDENSNNLLNNPVFYNSLTQEEVDDMESLAYKIQYSKKFVEEHQHEITTMFTNSDWLDVYSKSVLEYGVDMDHFIQNTNGEAVDSKEDWK
jgi:hypothetical protein